MCPRCQLLTKRSSARTCRVNPGADTLDEMAAVTDICLRVQRCAVQATGKAMGIMVVQERARWLNLTNLPDREKEDVLDMPIVPEGIFGSALASMQRRCESKKKEDEALHLCLPRRVQPLPSQQQSFAQAASNPARLKHRRHRGRSPPRVWRARRVMVTVKCVMALRHWLHPSSLVRGVHDWPPGLLYAFPPLALISPTLARVREQRHTLILIAPHWPAMYWLAEIYQLLCGQPWQLPLRRDILSQAGGGDLSPTPRALGSMGLAREWYNLNTV
ncbi:hypothetical protein CesoFtcFv8_013737 [Champsocephalus esox]|uniref:Uncharacterized protein n=1 Tax=Champsocephalus esox TaxID=159716 RepID=A0AAN8BVD2_9TELE|nr:hypothetical protein CesoFtcFv8_013737 [Champsocephalus esox]